jgi:GNAT superfamily N-acetyltransferase
MPFADQDLARRVEDAWAYLGVENARAQARLDPHSDADSLPVGGGYAVFMGAGSPLSQAQGMGLYGPVAEADLERMEDFYRRRGAPVQLELSSLADATLLGLLGRRGYRAVHQTHVLVRPIGAREPSAPAGADRDRDRQAEDRAKDVAVAAVGPGEVATWAESVLRCFFEDPAELPRALLEGAIAMASIRAVSCWLARVGGRIAGGGAMVIHNRLALICGDGTLPEFRSQGVQAALLRARLDRARRVGCDLAVICTQPGSSSQRNAERQGFQVVYARTLMGRE